MYFQTIHQIILTGHWITEQINKELKLVDFTEPQYNVLRSLKEANGKPLTVQELQSKMVQRSSNVTRIIDKLIKKNCVERKECPTNRRKMDITITTEGLELLKKLDKKVIDFHQPLMQNLTEQELEVLKSLILKLKGTQA
jgi:DNA-binding MarR family transcriptional regulator